MSIIYHITQRSTWEKAQAAGAYRGDTLDSQGFIHNSTAAQVVGVANRFYNGQSGLVLLYIDTDKVQSRVVFEYPIDPTTGQPEAAKGEFPHLYGPLNLDAVVRVVDFAPGADGTFTLPEGIKD